jgi:alpha-L-fucosidase
MKKRGVSRRNFLERLGAGGAAAAGAALAGGASSLAFTENEQTTSTLATAAERGAQRLSLAKLQAWEALGYGMFIHFGMSTYVGDELPDGKAPAFTYNPDELDVDQWVQIARDAGMKYAVLTAKHVAGHCLWPSKFTDYTVAQSGNRTDVVEAFVRACARRGVLPGIYYCSWDNHNLFGSFTPSFGGVLKGDGDEKGSPAYTTSLYQDFQTAQVTELLTSYGPIAEIWIDIPGVLGRGYRTYLYEHIAELQPECVVMMNSGISNAARYRVGYAWPSDLIALERNLPPASGHVKWREIEGKRYYLPGEVCDTLTKNWFYLEGDHPRLDEDLLSMLTKTRQRGANLLLDVPPNKHGRIFDEFRDALMRLRRSANL